MTDRSNPNITDAATESLGQPGTPVPVEEIAKPAATQNRARLDFVRNPVRHPLGGDADMWASLTRPDGLNRAIAEGRDIVVVDLRAPEDFANGHIPRAVSLPREQWHAAPSLSKERVNVLYCYSGTCPLGGEACAQLAGQGYPVVEMDGGFDVWQSSDFGIER